eukprot:6492227-Amphidinium_carterae.1
MVVSCGVFDCTAIKILSWTSCLCAVTVWMRPQEELVEDSCSSALVISPARLLPAESPDQSTLGVPALLWGARTLVERYGARVSKVSESVDGVLRKVVQLRVQAAAEQTA